MVLERRPAMPCVYHLFQQIRDGPFLSDQTILESSCEHVAPYQMVLSPGMRAGEKALSAR